jgi:CHAT domain-containing protein
MIADDLKEALSSNAKASFVYLSCCYGARVAGEEKLGMTDVLGLSDAIVQAGVPSVLAFSIPPLDSTASDLAASFYKNWALHGDLEIALFQTRHSVTKTVPNALSPVLILQR